MLQQRLPLAVLKPIPRFSGSCMFLPVATALTACGIETPNNIETEFLYALLQQRLPLAVLKRQMMLVMVFESELQQRLPLAVLKLKTVRVKPSVVTRRVATALTACGIETCVRGNFDRGKRSCNSAYRLRY